MIEFNGYLSGPAKKRFIQKALYSGLKTLGFGFLLISPIMIFFCIKLRTWIPITLFSILFCTMPISLYITLNARENRSDFPRKIVIEDNYIICIADKYEESRAVDDVKQIYDHGEFYELVFPFGKTSEKFICQKSLLAKGCLEQFENLFSDKIIRKY